MMTSAQIRSQFLDFFQSKGHTIVPSAPIVLKDDPTLLFTNAGMNQFKDYFLGNKKAPYNRAADTQKCLRVSGKHNDLEEVGVDTYHHTMFEMLGNWSFGDYFKKEAIEWSWELLTKVYQLDKDKLYVTIFEGDEKEGLPKDEEAFNEWKKYVAEDRILLGNKKDNFWEMGDTGPCGPCTEIHVDCRSDEERKQVAGATLVNNDHPQVIEIWNNVFIQFNRKKDGSLEPLPAQHVDTGMGFERLVRVIQGKQSNYDTDVFTGTIEAISKIVKKEYKAGDDKESISFRVLADHIRAISFCIADGQLPSNTGAGYVIRRILRRAVRYYYSYLDYKQPLLFQLLPVIANQFETVFPELYAQKDFVERVIKEEEEAFLRTLEKGLKKMEMFALENIPKYNYEILHRLSLIRENENGFFEKFKVFLNNGPALLPIHGKRNEVLNFINEFANNDQKEIIGNYAWINSSKLQIDGFRAFELYDTFGFPLDLIKLVANEYYLTVDEKGFENEMLQQKNRSRAATTLETEDWVTLIENVSNKFVGYDSLETKSNIIKYRKVTAKGKEQYQLVLDATPFYAESGGQVGDTGILQFGDEAITVTNTKKENDLIIHFTDQLPAAIETTVTAKVDAGRRKAIAVHHSVTHLMHAALRTVLGKHVAQKGSLVNNDYLRFDFSHFAKVTDEEIAAVEKLVNEKIRANIPVVIKSMHKDEAIALGAMALFGEKYGDIVRVVIMDPAYSLELCGGTHVGSTGELGIFKIQHESAVAAGVRRIEAVSGAAAESYINEQFVALDEIRGLLKNSKDIPKSIQYLQSENSQLSKRIEGLEARQLVGIRNELLQQDEIINNVTFVGAIIEVSNADGLKKLCTDLKSHLHDSVIVLCSNIDGKAFVAIGIADTVVAAKNLDATKLIKEQVAGLIKGGGGGQKNLGTAGGQDVSNFKTIIEKVKSLL
jgi:alanyl-tRNA synthetase